MSNPEQSATSAAIDAIGTQETAAAPDLQQDSQPDGDQGADQPIALENDREPSKPLDRLAAALDKVGVAPGDEDDSSLDKPTAKPADKPAAAEAPKPAEADAEEAELLAGVKSERGRERIQKVFAERKQLEADIGQFRQMVQSTGMDATQFANTLEFGRLVNSGDETSLRTALGMLDQQRADLAKRLGVDAPGVDALADHPDLAEAIENLEVTRERALELAKHRGKESRERQAREANQAAERSASEFNATVANAAGEMEAYLKTRANELDHPARMKIIGERFKDPGFMQQFVSTYQPQQWAATIRMMYDNIQAPRAPADPSPLRSRPAQLGTRANATAVAPIDRVAQRMESLGI